MNELNLIYKIDGMTCQSCVSTVNDTLQNIPGVISSDVNLERNEASLKMDKEIPLTLLQDALPDKYTIYMSEEKESVQNQSDEAPQSKLAQLKPLFLILFYISVASIAMHWNDLIPRQIMLDFMGMFFIVFSFFKMLDLKGFPITFSMYDPIAKLVPAYAKVYPFIETILGLMFLCRFEITSALIATIIILGFTTYGVTKTLLSKRKIKCACLGTALNLPMTEATFIENAIMIIMAIGMLFIL